ncbi:MAG: SpoIIE family protein phosphatase [Ignavibacteriaceae bacterium]|nr:SpoIIE family protein phosphatase [Ignavibacteriaceae bacterium]
MKTFFSWQKKLFIFALVIAIVPVIVVSLSSLSVVEDELKSRTNNELSLITKDVSGLINQYYMYELIPPAIQIKTSFENNDLTLTEKVNILTSIVQETGSFLKASIFLRDDMGDMLSAVETIKNDYKPFEGSEIFEYSFRRIEEISYSGNNIGSPKFDSIVGMWYSDIVLQLEIAGLEDVYLIITVGFQSLINKLKVHPQSEHYNFAFFDPEGNQVFLVNNILNSEDSIVVKSLELLNSDQRIRGVTSYTKGNLEYIGSYDFPENVELAFIASINKNIAYKAIEILVSRILLTIGLIVLVTSALVLLFYKSISSPILSLSKASNEIAKRNFDVEIPYQGKDSLGVLANSLREMNSELKANFDQIERQKQELEEYNKTLEQKVAERTAELEKANTDLTFVNSELAHQLKKAADYVESILPPPVKKGAIRTDWRFFPSADLGGDSFGYHEVDNENFALYLLDVCDHGVGPALLSVSALNVLRSQTLPNTDFREPAEVLGRLNDIFDSDRQNNLYFTMWYGVFNKNTRKLKYGSAGHPPALLLNNVHKSEELLTKNITIGQFPGFKYKSGETTVEPGSILYIFSDGCYEVDKAPGEVWTLEEMESLLKENIVNDGSEIDRLYSYLQNMHGDVNLPDDFSMLKIYFD